MSLISILLLTLHLTLSIQTKHTNEHALKQAVSALASTSIQNPIYLNKDKRDLFNSASSETSTNKCQKITVPMCQHMEYNLTSMPNQFNHETQQEAAMEAHQFWALVEINCSKDLRFFLCSMYTPVCVPNYPKPIRACKSVCIRARIGCEKYMKKFDFDWPEHMNCDLFPEYGSGKEVCMDPMDASNEQKSKHLNINHNINTEKPKPSPKKLEIIERKVNLIEIPSVDELFDQEATPNKPESAYLLDKMCTYPFIRLAPSQFDARYNKISTGGLTNCIQPCQSLFFTQSEQTFTYYWLIMWSVLCLASCLITGLTYLIQSSRFKYPEKPIIYLNICYLFVSAGYLVRFGVGREKSSCELDGSIKYSTSFNNSLLNVNQSSSSFACTLTFILVYYFGMASSVWWVIISFTWFLAAGLKWSTEAIAKYKFYFHMLAWLLPFVKTVAILTLSYIDADPLSGICYVGNLSTRNLRIFVLAPSLVYLLIGITFLASGFISLFRIRKLIKKQHGDWVKAHKLEKLMIRIGIFSILYTVPATCVIACQFYEQIYRAEWEKSALCKKHAKLNGLSDNLVYKFCAKSRDSSGLSESPEFSVFILKYLMSLIVGVTSGFWVWTNKTVKSWKMFFSRIFSCSATNGANKLDSTSTPSSANTTQDSVSCFGCCFSRKEEKKDSIVFFQANEDLEHNPHNYYEGKLVQPQLLINPIQDDMNIYEKKQFIRQVSSSSPINNQVQQFTLKSAGSIYHQPHDQILSSVEYKSGSVSTQPLYAVNSSNQVIQYQQAQSNGFFYDYSSTGGSSRNDRTTNTTSSKYSSASRK